MVRDASSLVFSARTRLAITAIGFAILTAPAPATAAAPFTRFEFSIYGGYSLLEGDGSEFYGQVRRLDTDVSDGPSGGLRMLVFVTPFLGFDTTLGAAGSHVVESVDINDPGVVPGVLESDPVFHTQFALLLQPPRWAVAPYALAGFGAAMLADRRASVLVAYGAGVRAVLAGGFGLRLDARRYATEHHGEVLESAFRNGEIVEFGVPFTDRIEFTDVTLAFSKSW